MGTLDIDIRIFSPETNQVFYPYFVENGKHHDIPPQAMRGISKHVLQQDKHYW
jgi:hypothetical protein